MSLEKHAATAPTWGRRIHGIEGLRGIAALMVLLTHAGAEMAAVTTSESGPLTEMDLLGHGLTLFFVLSGFLLYRPFAAAMLGGTSAPNFRRYMANRVLRIFPAYIVVLLLVSYVMQAARLSSASAQSKFEAAGAMSLGDLLFAIPLIQTFNPETVRVGLGVAWSLTTEFTFYLLLPLLAGLGMKLARRVPAVWATLVPIVLLLAIGWGGKAGLFLASRGLYGSEAYVFRWGQEWSAVFSRSIVVHGDLFAIGMLAAVLVVLFEHGVLPLARIHRTRIAAVAVLVIAGFMAVKNFPGRGFEDTAAAGAGAALVLLTVLPTAAGVQNRLSKVLDWTPLKYAGLVSYGIYLWHLPLMWWLQKNGLTFPDSAAGLLGNATVAIVVTCVFAGLTYRFVEKPVLSLKKRDGATRSMDGRERHVTPSGHR